jgi:voltage-gated potassium channel
MEGRKAQRHWLGRRLESRVHKKGITPRLAAGLIAAFWAVGVVIFGIVERLVNPETFDNVWLGMWWGVQTVTTVGYGDVVPGNTSGKVIASVLMFGGLSLFAVVTGAITSAFVAQAQEQRRAERGDPVGARLDDLNEQLEAIKAELARLK